MATATYDIASFIDSKDLNFHLVEELKEETLGDIQNFRKMVKTLDEADADGSKGNDRIKYGILCYYTGRMDDAYELLNSGGKNEVRSYFLAKCLIDQRRYAEADNVLAESESKAVQVLYARAEAKRLLGEIKGAIKLINEAKKDHSDTVDYRFQDAYNIEVEGNYREALEAYEAIYEDHPEHTPTGFRLALNHALRGDEERAVFIYEELASTLPTFVNVLVNLGIIYEDQGKYPQAIGCFRRVLKLQPANIRARMYLHDAEASVDMFYDEERERSQDRRTQILRIPVSEFELSVRARNCLNKMDIHTLGDLIEKTEAELLSEKNFGETSLVEVKEMLGQKGLRLGQGRPDHIPVGADQAVLNKGASELGLSVRSRKCIEKLNIRSVSDLIQHSEAELLMAKNFGQTSLTEIKQKLVEMNLSLRSD